MNTIASRFSPTFLGTFGLALTLALLSGCQSGKDKEPLDTVGDNSDMGPSEPADSDGLPEVDTAALFFQKVDALDPVYFAFDSSALDQAALAEVREAAELFLTDPNVIIQVEGHCDERGTQEYNLALGERRAQSVRDHLRTLGVSGNRITTISYGEERPAVDGSGEAAWAKNRRCEFTTAQ